VAARECLREATATIEIRVLGPIELVGEAGPVPLAPMPRRLLAAMASRAGETCSADWLLEALWGEQAPASASKLLQVYVSQLRKALPPPARIERRGGGYGLEMDEHVLDAARFERLLREGRDAFREANPALAHSLLRRGLALWRGSAYGEFAYEEFARGEAERLEELRLACQEEQLEADLELGRHDQVLPELQHLMIEQPLRERLFALAMLAFYRCGRQTEALDLYAEFRSRLREQLGLEPARELRELQRRILQHDDTLTAAGANEPHPSALPLPPNRLLGREREVEELRSLLLQEDVRLLTLSGAGGSGKTRLALEVAREVAGAFANGAVFVGLAPLRDAAIVPAAIAGALEIPQAAGESPAEALARSLQPRELLLLLDNAEHVREAAPLFTDLLAHAPRLRIVVTSRTVLHLSGEHVYPVQPLATDAAVALFHERAREADPHFHADAPAESAIRDICKRLDSLPLAIELAAGHVRAVTPRELLARLEPRLPLLAGGPRDLPARQQTLRATLEWSHNLLGEEAQRDLRALSVFAGGCTLEAAESVCGATPDRVAILLDHNLLSRTTTPDGSRYTMLETIREYVLEQMEATPESADIKQRHTEFFLGVAESANLNPGKLAPGGQHLEIANAEQDNVRAALAWALASGSIGLAFRLAIAMDQFWTTHDPGEGIRWYAELFDRPRREGVTPELRAHALRGYGSSFALAGDGEAAERLWKQSLALFEELGDEHGRAVLLHRLGVLALWKGDLERARRLVEESEAIHAQSDDHWKRIFGLAQTTGTLGAIARDAGEPQRAAELIEQSAAMSREVAVPWWESGMLAELACLSIEAGRIDEAESRARHSLVIAEQLHDHAGRIFGVGLLAAVAAQRGDPERARALWGAIEHEDAVAPLGGWRRHRETCKALIHQNTAGDVVNTRANGRTLTLDEAVPLALGTQNIETELAKPA
jgi:predicted ATPase/DNA-binding SARP family transcriptional activator